ncbi:MAG: enoyl-CoA hydratase-related protein [Nitrospirales bacterium]|nr:enoyl-CoA hydratase-related protein [Nitrospirales bacterium]
MSTTAPTWLTQRVRDSVATVTINHPPANVLTFQGLIELESTVDNLTNNNQIKVVIITGAGRFFMAGADIRMLAEINSTEKGREMAQKGQGVFNKIEASRKPFIAALNGPCLGGGLELALCCHIRVAAEGIHLGQPEINLGIIPGFGGTQRLQRLIGKSKATALILTGDPISSQEAKTLGLVSQVFPPDDLLPQATELARQIASKGQLAVQAALQALQQGSELRLRDALRLEANLFGDLCESSDKQEGMAAFLEKRQPRFKDQ